MKTLLLTLACLIGCAILHSQSFVDVLQIKHALPLSSEETGYEPISSIKLEAGVQAFGPHYLLINYFGSRRVIQSDAFDLTGTRDIYENGIAAGVYLLPEGKPWKLMLLGRLQWNGVYQDGNWPDMQPALFALFQYRINPKLQVDVGSYYARQLFGGFYIPVIGGTWQVGDEWTLSLRAPQSGTLRWADSQKPLAGGAWFEAVIQSFDIPGQPFDHLQSNEIYAGVFGEFAMWPFLVLRVEPAYALSQNLQWQDANGDLIVEEARPGSFYLRFGLHYRMYTN